MDQASGFMSARIVHFGEDRFNRLGPLRDAGYSVHACGTLEELRTAVVSCLPVDALTIAETEDAPLDDAMAIARSASRAPLIFFQGSTHDRKQVGVQLGGSTSRKSRNLAGGDCRAH